MSGSRERILAQIRRSLHRAGPLDASVQHALAERTRAARPHLQPAMAGDLIERFIEKAHAAAAEIERLVSHESVSHAVLDYLERKDLPKALVTSSDAAMAAVRWSNELAVERRPARDADRVSVTTAFAGIAETGTVAMISAPTHPTTLNFLPEHHIVVLSREHIVAHLEDLWIRLRREHPAMPRTVNLITGPSRTGDVELTMEFGAHGPRCLYVLLVG